MSDQMREPYETDDPRLAALLLTLDFPIIGRSITDHGRVTFRFSGVPSRVLDQLLDTTPEMRLLRRFVGNLEQIYAVISQTRRERLR